MKFDPWYNPFPSQRNVIYGSRGMVATSHPLAAQAGLEVLKKGGNAVDAAIATAAALTVVEPTSNGIGSDNFAIIWKDGKLKVPVTVVTQEGSAAEAAEALIQAGLFISYEDYELICIRAGVHADDIKATEFTFPAGTTQEDIVIEVTKEME